MNDESRPDPDALLAALKQEETSRRFGKLTIFLGMCAGVGKTYSMLRMAQQRRAEGVNLVVAFVETHGRTETQALLEGLPAMPRLRLEYRGTVLQEMDLDATLSRKPDLAIVDEFAHTNAPGSRHPKRYQDVLELLDAGIDVYTTLNVQHIESRVDVVRQMTGVSVRETVPDSVLDQADDIQLVDLTPEALRERLAEGKVYTGGMAQTAASHFFREENLNALRELALRVTAERVHQDLREVLAARQVAGPWKTHARLMVAVGPSPYSEELVRWTRQAAAAQGAPWVAIHVDDGRALTDAEKARLAKTLSLGRQLGARVITVAGEDLLEALLRAARQENATQIVVGKTRVNALTDFLKGGSFVDRLIRLSGDIDVCAVRAGPQRRRLFGPLTAPAFRAWPRETAMGLGAVAAVTAVCWALRTWIGPWTIGLVYLCLVVVLSTRLGQIAILLIAAASALLWDFLFIQPPFTLRIEHLQDAFMCVMYFIVALVIGQLTARVRLRELLERKKEARTASLYRLAQGVAESTTLEEGLRRALAEIHTVFGSQCAVHLVGTDGRLGPLPHPASSWPLSDKEQSVAAWSLAHGQPAGHHTDTLPESESLHIPLQTAKNKVGVLSVHFGARQTLALDERELLETFADQIAIMVERFWLIQEAGRASLAEESEKLYKTLFDSVSHEIKTPLSAIQAAVGELCVVFNLLPQARPAQPFLKDIEAAARRLGRIVDNLLSMTRIEAGRYKQEAAWCSVAEIVDAAQDQVADLLAPHPVKVVVPPGLPAVKLDAGFMEQALANLLANAAQYSAPESEIAVSAHLDGSFLVMRVKDRGPGIPAEALPFIFDKFYRLPDAPPGGLGLGLSIVRGLMHAMGGEVFAKNDPDHGAVFLLRVPVDVKRTNEAGT
ncbi:MAG: sensor histidine kinase KdpD [Kiritimatiellia bacterium]